MSKTDSGVLVVGIPSHALLDVSTDRAVRESDGVAEYRSLQRRKEDVPFGAGPALPTVRRLLAINDRADSRLVEIVVISDDDADTALRVMNSALQLDLPLLRWAFTDGRPAWPYLGALGCNLYLSPDTGEVRAAVDRDLPAARILAVDQEPGESLDGEVRITLDGDSVAFDESSRRILADRGLAAFVDNEERHAGRPLDPGSRRGFLDAVRDINHRFPADERPIRVSLVTAHNAPAHRRIVSALREWDDVTNETFFTGGLDKEAILAVLRPHIAFDEHARHLVPSEGAVPAASGSSGVNGSTRAGTQPAPDVPRPASPLDAPASAPPVFGDVSASADESTEDDQDAAASRPSSRLDRASAAPHRINGASLGSRPTGDAGSEAESAGRTSPDAVDGGPPPPPPGARDDTAADTPVDRPPHTVRIEDTDIAAPDSAPEEESDKTERRGFWRRSRTG